MANHLENMMDSTMEKIRQMVDVNTIIGEPVVCPDGTVIIPVSKVSYGFASGGSDLPNKGGASKDNFAGGSGAGVSIQPVAFLVVNNGNVKMLNMEFDGAVDRVISMIPDITDKVSELFKKMGKDKKKNDDGDIPTAKPVDDESAPLY
ncbi:MAG: GerW family sporulation protein [Clostridia bacterium]|nr:GerW family sporulation protein [Clostridia bacterium]